MHVFDGKKTEFPFFVFPIFRYCRKEVVHLQISAETDFGVRDRFSTYPSSSVTSFPSFLSAKWFNFSSGQVYGDKCHKCCLSMKEENVSKVSKDTRENNIPALVAIVEWVWEQIFDGNLQHSQGSSQDFGLCLFYLQMSRWRHFFTANGDFDLKQTRSLEIACELTTQICKMLWDIAGRICLKICFLKC